MPPSGVSSPTTILTPSRHLVCCTLAAPESPLSSPPYSDTHVGSPHPPSVRTDLITTALGDQVRARSRLAHQFDTFDTFCAFGL